VELDISSVFFGFVDEVLRRHTPLAHSHCIERSDPPALFEMKCRRRPDLMHITTLSFGTENLYEPKERLLITQKRGLIDGVRLEDIEPGQPPHALLEVMLRNIPRFTVI